MSVIQQIRDKYSAVVIAVIAISLIAFILMDAFVGDRRGAQGGRIMGEVNGQKIERNEFEKKVNLQQAMYGQQAPQREQLIGQVWDQQVDEIVMNQEYEKLGLQFTSKELNDHLFGANPPQWLSSQFVDKNTGAFDANAAKQYFAQVKKQKNNENAQMINDAYILPTITQQLRAKYMALLSNSTYVPKWMAERSLADQNSVARFSYVSVPYSSVTDTTLNKVTDEEIKAYINKHKEMFKQEEASRSISYVAFNAAPSSQDSAKVLQQIEGLKSDFEASTDPEAFLGRAASDMPYYNGYTLGSKMQVPNADSIKSLANGQSFGPYLDGKNYVIAKMIDRRRMPDSVKVRHILVKTGDKGQVTVPDSLAKKRIDSLASAAQSGADFNMLVQQFSDDEGSKGTKGEYDFTSQQFGNLSKEFAEVAFYGNTGDKKVVKVDNQSYSGYHYIEVMSQKNIETGYKVAYLAKEIDASQETINSANNLASQFAGTSRDKKQFEENARKQNLPVMNVQEVKQNDYQIPNVGENRSLVRWIYEGKTGDVSEPFEVNDKFIVAMITETSEKGTMSVAKARPSAEPMIINEKKAQFIINNKFKSAGTDINQVAQAAGVTVQFADSVSFSQPFIPNIGNEPKITGAAFNKSLQNKVSSPIAGNTGVFVIKGESVLAVPNIGMDVEGLRKQMESQAKQMGAYQSIQALKKSAEIEDKRFDFY